MRRRALVVAASVIALALSLTGCANDPLAEQYRDGTGQNYIAGDGSFLEIVPANRDEPIVFEGVTETGEHVSSTDHAGDVLVVNFWASYCVPCRVEAPDLEALSQEWAGDGVTFLGINTWDEPETALAFSRTYGVTYPSIMDAASGSAQLAFAGKVPPSALPTTIVLDREGRVAARILGQLQAKSILDSIIDRVAGEETSPGSQG
ncbi:MAG TPA: TlpA disulfide reductase family protein [Terrimesophilobacter sp.]|nr:TlpA disulfide reductase family protein [Terrimesophilobacter sp.]